MAFTYVYAGINRQIDGAGRDDGGNYSTYAGPATIQAAGTCVYWQGQYGSKKWGSGWTHCG